MQEPQQRPQFRDPALDCAQTRPSALRQHEADHVHTGQGLDVHAILPAGVFAKEPSGQVLIAQHRRRREPTFGGQPVPVGADQLIQRGGWGHGDHRDDVLVPQVRQQHVEAAHGRHPRVTFTAASRQELLDVGFVELRGLEPFGFHPPADLSKHLQLVPDRARCVTQRQQPRPVALHEWAQPPWLPAILVHHHASVPEHHAPTTKVSNGNGIMPTASTKEPSPHLGFRDCLSRLVGIMTRSA